LGSSDQHLHYGNWEKQRKNLAARRVDENRAIAKEVLGPWAAFWLNFREKSLLGNKVRAERARARGEEPEEFPMEVYQVR
jgi:hypothetical protein